MPSFQIEQLKQLPQRLDAIWQGRLVRMPAWVKPDDDATPMRPIMPMWLAAQQDKIGPGELVAPEESHPDLLWDALIAFATDEQLAGYRPGRVEIDDEEMAERFRPALEQAGIELVCCDNLPELDAAVTEMAEHMRGGSLPAGWATGQGVTVERMRAFADAAAAVFKAQPWRYLSNEDLLHIESPHAPEGMRYATVLGAGGETFGLSFYDTPVQKWALYRMESPYQWQVAFAKGAWSVTACDLTDLPLDDADLWQDHDLPVADASSYPVLMHYQTDQPIRRPDADRLAFVEALLRALAASTEDQIDIGRWSIEMTTIDGPVTVTLALPDLLDPPDHKTWMDRGLQPDRRMMDQMHAQMQRLMEGKQFENPDQINELLHREFNGEAIDPDRFPPRNDLERAQALCYQAFDTHGRRRVQLARQALEISPDCAASP